tara:strand:+ start:52 stop:405 length:354 start_codon:yes stop_codon:yes gene_type:complete
MIGMIFKFSIAFVLSYFILSMNFSNRPLFYHLSKLTGPVGEDIQQTIGKSVKRSFRKSKELGKQFLNSSEPKYLGDAIKSKQSAVRKKRYKASNSHLIQEELRREEKLQLDKVIDKN